jgi:hypothetical protein
MPAPSPQHDVTEAERFLALLDEQAEGFCFRVFDDNEARKDPRLAAKFSGPLTSVVPHLLAKQAQGCGVYVVANAGEQTNDTIYQVRAVFADTDGADLDPIMRCGLDPHIVVESSPGKWHVYWLVDGLPTEAFRDIQRNIAAEFGTDKSVNDLARVMRLPGFVHQKQAPFLVRIIHESGAVPYSAEQIVARFGTAHASQTHAPAPGLDSPVLADRHADILKCTLLLAAAIRAGGLTRDEALATMRQRRDAGRWSRHVPDDEIIRALDGAMQKGGAAMLPPACEAGPQPLVVVPLADVMRATLRPPPFVIAPYIPRSVVTLLGGHGGIGKSMLALTLLAHVAAGREWGGAAVERGKAVCLSFEDDGEIVRFRLRQVIEAYDLPADEVLANLQVFDGTQIEAELMREVSHGGVSDLIETPTLAEAEAACAGADLIVIDNASDVYGGAENVRAQVRKFVRRLARIAKHNGAGLALLVHIDKSAAKHGSQGNSYSGSTAWHNSARSRLALLALEDGSIELHQEKLNLGKKAEPLLLEHDDRGVLMPRASGASRQAANDGQASMDAGDVLIALTRAIEAGLTVPTATSGPAQAFHALEQTPELPANLKTKDGRKRVNAALLRLQRDGMIRRIEFQKPNRHTGERWELAQTEAGSAGSPCG